MEELRIEYLPVDSLKPYERNAKLHPAEQVAQIKRSIEDNGMNDPIGIWGKDNTIVEGHGRWLACKELGMQTVPVIRLDHMTDAQRKEYALIHNQTTMNSGLDLDILNMELADLPDFDAGFYGFEIDAFVEDVADGGEIPNKENAQVAVKMIFENAKEWRKNERAVREFVEKLHGVSVSVGEYDEDK